MTRQDAEEWGSVVLTKIFHLCMFVAWWGGLAILGQTCRRTEMPCLEYREDTCLECYSFDVVGSSYRCIDWAYEPCQICVARMARDPERKP